MLDLKPDEGDDFVSQLGAAAAPGFHRLQIPYAFLKPVDLDIRGALGESRLHAFFQELKKREFIAGTGLAGQIGRASCRERV